ncbi:hypothetical protein GTY67_19555 [Streptomyces sp. SID8374]|uniref:hypothetical protein n=1 Tax=Streptomyces sp. SID8374 TaxID=2690354 RepID=UPI00136F153F|nr:hypothetical protein [Streptomyces sp. SID8374]MYX15558.1 hypothetical protein [Streptomyces sp. SID8374]
MKEAHTMAADRGTGDEVDEVFVLWHARHLVVDEDGRTTHRDPDGEMHVDEEEWRILGIFTDEAAAEARRGLSRELPGFRDEPDCFDISPLVLDEDMWTDGYFTEYPEGHQQTDPSPCPTGGQTFPPADRHPADRHEDVK